jgi:hypothetical protein
MSGLPSAHGEQIRLPAVVEELLVEVAEDGFTLYCCGPTTAPTALVACYAWEHYIDLITIQDFDRVSTARLPTRDTSVDIFAPQVAVWTHEGPPQRALRAVLDLVHPAHPEAPRASYPAPASLHVPRAQQRPMIIRLPPPGRTRVRADRLATAIKTHGEVAPVVSAAVPPEALNSRLAAG